MPQKKSTTKKTSTTKRKRSAKKPKVYIPAYKAIILCCIIITICMGLLLFTTLKTPNQKLADAAVERYQEDKKEEKKTEALKTETKKSDSKKSEPAPAKKSESAKTSETKNKIETPQVKEEKKSSDKKSENKTAQTTKPAETAKTEKPAATPATKNTQQVPTPKQTEQNTQFNFPPAKNNAQLIFVFDDGGQNLSQLKPFLQLPFPITVAVLPQIAHSAEAAAQVRASGNEVILHQPMQSVNASVNPGPGAIKPEMSDEQIKTILFNNINEIAPIAGMNNHEGSGITADAEKMAVILQMASEEGIYFLDSRTNVETKVPYVARELGYSYYERNIFLDNNFKENNFKDNDKTRNNFLTELNKGLVFANKNGSVIMIGHIWSAEILPKYLKEVYPELKAKGYTFSVVSKSRAKKN